MFTSNLRYKSSFDLYWTLHLNAIWLRLEDRNLSYFVTIVEINKFVTPRICGHTSKEEAPCDSCKFFSCLLGVDKVILFFFSMLLYIESVDTVVVLCALDPLHEVGPNLPSLNVQWSDFMVSNELRLFFSPELVESYHQNRDMYIS